MVRVGADFSAITKQSKKATGSVVTMMSRINRSTTKLEGLCGRMNKALGAVGLGISALAVVRFAKDAAAAYNEVQENNAALAQVMKNTMAASRGEYRAILDLCDAQQRLGVIDAEVTKAGAVEMATYLGQADSLRKLLPVLNDMLAQQYGLHASSENAVNIATMLGKVMNGQVGALSRYGYSFTEAQAAILKYGDEAQRAAVLAEVVEDSVGGMNAALAQTPSGRLHQVKFALEGIREGFGKAVMTIATAFLPLLNTVVALLGRIAAVANRAAQSIANVFGVKTKPQAAAGLAGVAGAADKVTDAVDEIGGAAEKANKKLGVLSFDALNVLSDAASASGGGSGGEEDSLAGSYGGVDWSSADTDEAAESVAWLEKALRRLKETAEKLDFGPLQESWGRLKESAAGLAKTIGTGLAWGYEHVLEPLAVWVVNKLAPASVDMLADALYGLDGVFHALAPAANWLWTYVLGPIAERFSRLVVFLEGKVGSAFRAVGDFFNGKTIDIAALYNDIGAIGGALGLESLRMVGDLGRLMDKIGALKTFAQNCCNAVQAAWQGLQEFFSDMPGWVQSRVIAPMVAGARRGINGIIGFFEGLANRAVDAANTVVRALNRIRFNIPDWVPLIGGNSFGFNLQPAARVQLPRLEKGGILKSAGLFLANENGVPEMVGRMGRAAAVANNGQIVEGISEGVRDANEDVVTAIYSVAQQIIDYLRGSGGGFDLGGYIARQQRETSRIYG